MIDYYAIPIGFSNCISIVHNCASDENQLDLPACSLLVPPIKIQLYHFHTDEHARI